MTLGESVGIRKKRKKKLALSWYKLFVDIILNEYGVTIKLMI